MRKLAHRREINPSGPARHRMLVGASIVIGFLLVRPVAWLFGALAWPGFDGLGHVAWIVAWPALSVLAGVALVAVDRWRTRRRLERASGHKLSERHRSAA